jgi:hypothetical protein
VSAGWLKEINGYASLKTKGHAMHGLFLWLTVLVAKIIKFKGKIRYFLLQQSNRRLQVITLSASHA